MEETDHRTDTLIKSILFYDGNPAQNNALKSPLYNSTKSHFTKHPPTPQQQTLPKPIHHPPSLESLLRQPQQYE